jgi:hypothetical protein
LYRRIRKLNNTPVPTYFSSVTGILNWADGIQSARYLSTDYSMPYVIKDGQYQYFAWNEQDKKFYLVMTSKKDLQEKEK